MSRDPLKRGQWFRLPSGKLAEVCALAVEHPEAVLRYLNGDGAMAPGEFHVSVDFLQKHGKRVAVALPATA